MTPTVHRDCGPSCETAASLGWLARNQTAGGRMSGIAITGLGVVSALGHDVKSFHQGLASGRVTIAAAPWAGGGAGEYFSWMSLISGFEPLDWMDEKVRDGTDLLISDIQE